MDRDHRLGRRGPAGAVPSPSQQVIRVVNVSAERRAAPIRLPSEDCRPFGVRLLVLVVAVRFSSVVVAFRNVVAVEQEPEGLLVALCRRLSVVWVEAEHRFQNERQQILSSALAVTLPEDPLHPLADALGSVFDANSLGKWIYDWTVYHHGAGSPIGEMSGELWLLLIQLAGKMKRAEILPKIRTQDNKEMVDGFIVAGGRLTDMLRKLLNACEGPMLRSSTKQKNEGQLGKNAGVEFVETLFGPDRKLDKTQRFMASVRLWILRFDTNCEEIFKKPIM